MTEPALEPYVRPFWLLQRDERERLERRIVAGLGHGGDAKLLLAEVVRLADGLRMATMQIEAFGALESSTEIATAELKKTNDQLVADLERANRAHHWAVALIDHGYDAILRQAENYVETPGEFEGQRVVFTVQKAGKLTPDAKCKALQILLDQKGERIAALEAEVAKLKMGAGR